MHSSRALISQAPFPDPGAAGKFPPGQLVTCKIPTEQPILETEDGFFR